MKVIAAPIQIDNTLILKYRKDLLILLASASRVTTFKEAEQVDKAFQKYDENWYELLYQGLFKMVQNPNNYQKHGLHGPIDGWLKYWDKKLREVGWILHIDLRLPIFYDHLLTEDVIMAKFFNARKPWLAKVKRSARGLLGFGRRIFQMACEQCQFTRATTSSRGERSNPRTNGD